MSASRQLPMSADRKDLFRSLGLQEHNSSHMALHKLLLEEASFGRDQLSSNPDNLTGPTRANPAVTKPYKWDELSETAKHREILSIVSRASVQTSPWYQYGKYGTVTEENWVVRWYLWHSFRYRDNRDNGNRHRAGNGNGAGRGYYDPVRQV